MMHKELGYGFCVRRVSNGEMELPGVSGLMKGIQTKHHFRSNAWPSWVPSWAIQNPPRLASWVLGHAMGCITTPFVPPKCPSGRTGL